MALRTLSIAASLARRGAKSQKRLGAGWAGPVSCKPAWSCATLQQQPCRMASTSPSKPLQLYTWRTPNGVVPTIYLEELRNLYPDISWSESRVDISTNVQKEPWFLKLNPNGRIPVLVHHARGDFPVFETSAILLYLAQTYDKEYKLWFDPQSRPKEYSEMLQWLFFAHGGIGPMQGQSSHFHRAAPIDIFYAKKRYLKETKRLYGVLDGRLSDRDFLAGDDRGKYSLADIKTFPWVKGHWFAGLENLDEFPAVQAWLERCTGREATQAAYDSFEST